MLVGGMWIQPDMNAPSGESLVRQLLYSQRYFKEKFGVTLAEDYPEALKKSVKYLELDGDRLRIKDEYLYVQNSILMAFMEEIGS